MTEQQTTDWTGFFPRLRSTLARASAAVDDYTATQFNAPLTRRLIEEAR